MTRCFRRCANHRQLNFDTAFAFSDIHYLVHVEGSPLTHQPSAKRCSLHLTDAGQALHQSFQTLLQP